MYSDDTKNHSITAFEPVFLGGALNGKFCIR